jgi:hypothetical protein
MEPGVVVALLIGLASIALAVWQTVKASKDSLRRHMKERRTDAFLEVLRIVERHGLWIQDRADNLSHADLIDAGVVSRIEASEPPREDFANAEALVAAFGSADIDDAFASWRRSVAIADEEFDDMRYIAMEVLGPQENPSAEKMVLAATSERDCRREFRSRVRTALVADR